MAVYNDEAEQSVISAVRVCLAGELIEADGLRPEHFSRPSLGLIWAAVHALHEAGTTIDEITVVNELTRTGSLENAGGENWVRQKLIGAGDLPTTLRDHAAIVVADARFRGLVEAGRKVVEGATQRDDELVTQGLGELEHAQAISTGHTSIVQRQDELYDYFAGNPVKPIPLPFEALNAMTYGGLRPGQLTIFGGLRGHGKSILLPMILERACREDLRVALYLNEDTHLDQDLRYVSRHANVPFKRVMMGNPGPGPETDRVLDAIAKLPYEVVDAHGWSAPEIDRHIRSNRWHLAGIDLLNGVVPSSQTHEIDANVKLLRATAGRTGCHIIATNHLNRARDVGTYPEPPVLRDLRGSAQLADFATNVLFIYLEGAREGGKPDGALTGEKSDRAVINFAKLKAGKTEAMRATLEGSRMLLRPVSDVGTVGGLPG